MALDGVVALAGLRIDGVAQCGEDNAALAGAGDGSREEALRAVGYRRLHRPPDDAGDEHAGPASAARMIERHVAGPGFQWFVERPRGRGRGGKTRTDLIEATPVGLLPAETATRDGGRLPQSCACSRWWRTSRRRTISGVLDRDIPRLPEILRAEPRLGRVQKGTGKRWEFDHDVIVDGERRPVRVVIEVAKDGGRPLLISAHVILK